MSATQNINPTEKANIKQSYVNTVKNKKQGWN